jgi:hypothetical protein
MKRLFVFLAVFLGVLATCFGDQEKLDQYFDKLAANKHVQGLESISEKDGGLIIKGLVYDRVRLDTIYVKSNHENKDEVVLLIADLESAFLRKNKDIRSISIDATKDSLVAKGEVDLLGGTFDVVLEGEFDINGNDVYYDIKKAKLGVLRVPQWVINGFKDRLNPFFRMDDLGIDLKLTKMIFKEDRILIR